MTYLFVLITLLVVLAGVISYTGDVLGTIIGKRRLSLFGARPKRSGQIIGVLAGILIMLVTLVTLAFAFSNARRALFEFQSVSEQNVQLGIQQEVLIKQIANLENQVNLQTQELEAALLELDAAIADREKAQDEFKVLQDQQAGLEADIETLNFQVKASERDVAAAEADLETAQGELSEAEAQVKEAQTELEQVQDDLETQVKEAQTELRGVQAELDEVTKAKDEAIQARDEARAQQQLLREENSELETINSELDQVNRARLAQITAQTEELRLLKEEVGVLTERLEEQANALAQAQSEAQAVNSRNLTYTVNQVVHTGVVDAKEPAAIRAQFTELLTAANDKAIQTRAGDIRLEPEQIESAVQEASQTSGADVITFRSTQNQYVSEPLSVSVEVAENRMLLEEGQLLVTRQIHLGSPEFQEQRNSVRSDLDKLFLTANSALLARGLADGVYPVTSESSLEIEGFTNQLLRLSGPVVVGLTASDDIYSGGPAKLEFIILN